MKHVLVLAVDRDNDFGDKADIQTPVIGISDIMSAAMRLGTADPEDSDINCLFAAIKIYEDLADEGGAEIALVCGNKRVGHISDKAIVEELDKVLEAVRPDSIILVSDGSEDEYVFPIISSRIPVDSVKRVYVKQAPGIEGFFYILSKFIRDSDKKRRFLGPLGWILMFVGLIFMLPNIAMYLSTNNGEYLYSMTGAIATLVIGIIFTIYAYETWSRLLLLYQRTLADFKSGNPKIIFTAIALALLVIGGIIGILATRDVYDGSLFHNALVFFSNFMWFLVFAVIFAAMGSAVEQYIRSKSISHPFIIGTISVLALAFVMQGIIDMVNSAVGYSYVGESMIVYEFVIGVVLGLCAALLHAGLKEYTPKEVGETDSDAVQ